VYIENTLGSNLIFGSDYPRIEVNKMFSAVAALPIRHDVLDSILQQNALAFLASAGPPPARSLAKSHVLHQTEQLVERRMGEGEASMNRIPSKSNEHANHFIN
jgi:hypothetical protein